MGDLSGKTLRGYVIQRQIGAGTSAIVYQAYQPTVDRYVAVKVILPDQVAMTDNGFGPTFDAEARLIARLEHPNVVPLYDFWHDEQGAFLVMRWMRGGTLRDMLKRQNALPLARTARLIGQIADALAAAHEAGIIHRDLKPENILLDERSNAYLTDFGIAKQSEQTGFKTERDDTLIGTVAYVSPEQIANQSQLGPASDIYSLGLIVYEMLAGKHPFQHLGTITITEFLNAHLKTAVPSIRDSRPDLPADLDRVLQKATAKSLSERYANILDFARELYTLGATQDSPPSILSVPPTVPAASPARLTPQQRNRRFMLQNVRAFWIDGLLQNSLYNSVLVELRLQASQLGHLWDTVLYAGLSPFETTSILEIFDRLNGKLVILGEPGSGKTTILLELARALLDRAECDAEHPIPVVFNLSPWSQSQKPIEAWLVEELISKYQVPRLVARSWVRDDELLLLLDGLDEVSADQRDACIRELNAFREQHRFVDMVVCSRYADYEALSTWLNLNGAIEVKPLSDPQIDRYLDQLGPAASELRPLLQTDHVFRELARSPLMLGILAASYGHKAPFQPLKGDSAEGIRSAIFANYVEQAFDRRSATMRYTRRETVQYLAWLAHQMKTHSQSLFQIEALQSSWLDQTQRRGYYFRTRVMFVAGAALLLGGWRVIDSFVQQVSVWAYGGLALVAGALWGGLLSTRWLKHVAVAAIPGILLGVAWGSGVAIRDGLTPGIVRGTISVFTNVIVLTTLATILRRTGNDKDHIVPIQKLRFSLKNANWYLALAAIGVAILYYFPRQYTFGAFFASFASCAMVAGMALFASGLNSDKVEVGASPNQGIHRSLRFGLRVGGAITLGSFVAAALQAFVAPGQAWLMVANGITAAVTIGHGAFLVSGFYPTLHHFWLRAVLWRHKLIPRNYAAFLDHGVQLILLRKVGGGYIFIHRYLLEYFAGLYGAGSQR